MLVLLVLIVLFSWSPAPLNLLAPLPHLFLSVKLVTPSCGLLTLVLAGCFLTVLGSVGRRCQEKRGSSGPGWLGSGLVLCAAIGLGLQTGHQPVTCGHGSTQCFGQLDLISPPFSAPVPVTGGALGLWSPAIPSPKAFPLRLKPRSILKLQVLWKWNLPLEIKDGVCSASKLGLLSDPQVRCSALRARRAFRRTWGQCRGCDPCCDDSAWWNFRSSSNWTCARKGASRMRLTPSAWSCRSIHSFCSAQPGPRQWCLSPVQFRCRSVGSGICSTSFVLDAGPAAIFPVAVRVRPRAALCRASASRACDEDPGLVRSRRRQCSPGVRNSQWRGWDRWTPFVRWRPASRSCIRPRFERGAPRQAAENQKAKCKTSSASARAAYTWPKETNHGVARGLSPGVDSGKCRTDSTGSIACLETATVGKEIFRSILGAGSATENPQPAYPIGLSNSVAAEYRGYQSHWHPPMNCCAYGPRTVAIILEPALRDFRVGGGEAWACPVRRSQSPCSSCPCPSQSLYRTGFADSIPELRPNARVGGHYFWSRDQGRAGQGQPSGRVSSARGFLLRCIFDSHGPPNAANSTFRRVASGRPSVFDLLASADIDPLQSQGLQPTSCATVGDGGIGLCKRIGLDFGKAIGDDSRTKIQSFCRFAKSRGCPKSQSCSKQKGKGIRRRSTRRSCRRRGVGSSSSGIHASEGREVQESNPLSSTILFQRCFACLPRWTLRTRTKFAWVLSRSFAIQFRFVETSSALHPLLLPSLDCLFSSGPGLSNRCSMAVCKARLPNVWVLVVDFLLLGRWPIVDELRRCPNESLFKVFFRLRSFLSACGEAQVVFSFCPGRSIPELASALYLLEAFARHSPDLKTGYIEQWIALSVKDSHLLYAEEFPELVPYKFLDVGCLKIIGVGQWHMADYLAGPLWLPCQGSSLSLRDQPVSPERMPNFIVEMSLECLKLAKVWDSRWLLFLYPHPLAPGHFSRVFNAFKDRDRDRQDGDRRLRNMHEYHIDGPSKSLPLGSQLTCLRIPWFTHVLRGSITERLASYHQAKVTIECSQSNMLPFAFPSFDFQGTRALDLSLADWTCPATSQQIIVGDRLGFSGQRPPKKKGILPGPLYPCFASLLQGDHFGVEFALRSLSLLGNHGLLSPENRLLGGQPVPVGMCWGASAAPDYLASLVEAIVSLSDRGFAGRALAVARGIFVKEGLSGFGGVDVCAQATVKVAGAEVRSSSKNARLGFVPISVSLARRLSLSVLSVRAVGFLGVITDLIARPVGNWVLLLQFRKCLPSLVDFLSRFSADCLTCLGDVALSLSRVNVQGLSLSVIRLSLIVSKLVVDYLGQVFVIDVLDEISPTVQAGLCLHANKRGSFIHPDNGCRALLCQVGEADDDLYRPVPVLLSEPITEQPFLYFGFVEICGGARKVSEALARKGRSVAPILDLSHSRHHDLTSERLVEWAIYLIEEDRFRSFLIAPPCTSFSPAAHHAVGSYKEPLGFDRLNPRMLLGNFLALRTLLLLRVERSRLNKICWLILWKSLLSQEFDEVFTAPCVFGSIQREEFRRLCHILDVCFLERRCPGGHDDVRIEEACTKSLAVHVDGLADRIAGASHFALHSFNAQHWLSPEVEGLGSTVSNDVMLTSRWDIIRSWFWKKPVRINVLELAAAASNLWSVVTRRVSVRFCSFIGFAVCCGVLAKGRSVSHALQLGPKRACPWCICSDLYPAWLFSSAYLNVVGDPTWDCQLRPSLGSSISRLVGLALLDLASLASRCLTIYWLRLVALAVTTKPIDAVPFGFQWVPAVSVLLDFVAFAVCWILCSCCLLCAFHFACPAVVEYLKIAPKRSLKPRPFGKPVRAAMVIWLLLSPGAAMHMSPKSAAEHQRFGRREGVQLGAMRAIKQQIRERRETYSTWSWNWLWGEKQVPLRNLIELIPPDPERLAESLFEYGKEFYRAGNAYGVCAETKSSVAAERPLIRRKPTTAWDLAFAWLQNELRPHHPAMSTSIMTAHVVVSLYWRWAYEAAIILMSWTGVIRIGEVLTAERRGVVLPVDSAPGASFVLIVVRQPKTRGKAARHQAARIDKVDVIRGKKADLVIGGCCGLKEPYGCSSKQTAQTTFVDMAVGSVRRSMKSSFEKSW